MCLRTEGPVPPVLQRLLAELRREIGAQCPGVRVRVTYAPFQNIDAFVEVTVDGPDGPPGLTQLMEPRFQLAERHGYTVAVLVRPAAGPGAIR